ncbi:MAG: ABC transporter substrate-binding protein, partial [Cetobacterium sp.]
MKKIFILIFSTFLILSCNSKQEKDLEEVSIVLDWYPNAVHTFIYNAIENGYFKDEGIDLKIIYPS